MRSGHFKFTPAHRNASTLNSENTSCQIREGGLRYFWREAEGNRLLLFDQRALQLLEQRLLLGGRLQGDGLDGVVHFRRNVTRPVDGPNLFSGVADKLNSRCVVGRGETNLNVLVRATALQSSQNVANFIDVVHPGVFITQSRDLRTRNA